MHPIRKLRELGHATAEQFAALLADDVVMHSPLLIRAIVVATLWQRRWPLPRRTGIILGFMCWSASWTRIQRSFGGGARSRDTSSNSPELLTDGADGKLKERTVAYRPFPALRIFREKQRAATSALLPPNMWDYSFDNQTSSAQAIQSANSQNA